MLLESKDGSLIRTAAAAAALKVGSAFCEGWREKRFAEMTEDEVAAWFGEMTLLVSAEGPVQ